MPIIIRSNKNLAKHLDIHPYTVGKLIKKGVIEALPESSIKNGGNIFDLEDCKTRYAAYKKELNEKYYNGRRLW